MTRTEQLARQLEYQLPALLRQLNPAPEEDPMSDLSIPQLRLVRAIAECPRTPSELMEILGSSASSISQISSRLEESGLVERKSDASDRRRTHIQLSDMGRKLFEARMNIRLERTERALENLAPNDREAIVRLMGRMIEHSPIGSAFDMEFAN